MKLQERIRLHGLTIEQMQGELRDVERAMLDFRFDAGLNRLTNTAGMHHARKRIAALKTIIREKELLATHGFATMDEYKTYQVANRKTYQAAKLAAR
jgi:ribosomal protein L29